MAKREITFEPNEIGGHVREMKGSNGLSYRPVPVTGVKSIDGDGFPLGTVQAFVSVTGIEDNVQDIIAPGAYGKTLRERKPKGVWSHDWDTWVAKTISAVEMTPNSMDLPMEVKELGGGALFVTCQFNLNTTAGKDAYENVKFFDDDCEWSIGYSVPAGGAKYDTKSGVRTINELDLFEYSPVLFGAMSMTSTLSVKSAFQRERIRLNEIREDTESNELDASSDQKTIQATTEEAETPADEAVIEAKVAESAITSDEIAQKTVIATAPMANKSAEQQTKNDLVDLHSKIARAKQSGSAEASRSLGIALDHAENAEQAADSGDHPQASKSFNRASAHADNAAESLGDSTYGAKAADLADQLGMHAQAHLVLVAPTTSMVRPMKSANTESTQTHEEPDMICDHCQQKLEAKVAELEGKADAPPAESDDPSVDCPTCKGSGKIKGGNVKCPDCAGTGKVSPAEAAKLTGKDAKDDNQEVCPTCEGSGKVDNGTKECPTCNGSGVVGETQEGKAAKAAGDAPTAVTDALAQIDDLLDELMDAAGIPDPDESGDDSDATGDITVSAPVAAVIAQIDSLVDKLMTTLGVPDTDDDANEEKTAAKDKVRVALQEFVKAKKGDSASTTTETKAAVSSTNDGLTEDELLEFEMMRLRS